MCHSNLIQFEMAAGSDSLGRASEHESSRREDADNDRARRRTDEALFMFDDRKPCKSRDWDRAKGKVISPNLTTLSRSLPLRIA